MPVQDTVDSASLLNQLSLAYSDLGRFADAENALREAIKESPRFEFYINLGVMMFHKRELVEGEQLLLQAADIFSASYPGIKLPISLLINFGLNMRDQDRNKDALSTFEEIKDRLEEEQNTSNSAYITAIQNIHDVSRRMN